MTPSGADDVLFGRDADLARVRELVVGNRVVLVFGPAGVGKTSLVLAAVEDAFERGEVPPPLHVPLGGVTSLREAAAVTARALDDSAPLPEDTSDEAIADDLVALLARAPRVLVWDDVDERSAALAAATRAVAASAGPSRMVVVSRRFITPDEAKLRAVAFEVKPLSREAAVALVAHLERQRGRTLAEDLAHAAACNPSLIRSAMTDRSLVGAPVAHDASTVRRLAMGRPAREVLALLAAAGTMLDQGDLATVLGEGAREAIEDLRKHLVLVRVGERVGISPVFAAHVSEVIGAPTPASCRAVAKLAEMALAKAPLATNELLLGARAYVDAGEGEAALALIRAHEGAVAATPPAELETILRGLAARAPDLAAPLFVLLAEVLSAAGDFDAARRALDDVPRGLSPDEARVVAVHRARGHLRAGEPEAARRLLGGEDAESRIGCAAVDAARGDVLGARATLEELAEATRESPALEAARAIELAATYVYEERWELALAMCLRARAAHGAATPWTLAFFEVLARLGLGELDRAEELAGRSGDEVLEVLVLARRGDFVRALDLGASALASLDRRGDQLARAIVALHLTRAAVGQGQLARAVRLLRIGESVAEEPGLSALRPSCDLEDARLAEADGELLRARKSAERAHARSPRSPVAQIEREAMDGHAPAVAEDVPEAVRAFAALRSAEVMLRVGDAEGALAPAAEAERFHGAARLDHELARARLARAEALVRLARAAERDDEASDLRTHAEQALAACESVAEARRFRPVLAGAALVRAALTEDRGDLEATTRAVEAALRHAGDEIDTALARAAGRVGLPCPRPRVEITQRPYASRVERLGLDRPADVRWIVGERAWLRRATDPPPAALGCHVDVDLRRVVASDGRTVDLPEQRLLLLRVLAESGAAGLTLEEIFERVWRGVFHPLRHRNAVYVALTRLKESIRPLADVVRLAHEGDRYRLDAPLPVGVRVRVW